jgi:hypothetical protein
LNVPACAPRTKKTTARFDFDFRWSIAVRLTLAAAGAAGTTVTKIKTQAHRTSVQRPALAAAVVVLALFAFGGTALAGGRGLIGTVIPFTDRCSDAQKQGDCLENKDLQRLGRSHITTVRWGFRWIRIEPIRGEEPNWNVSDQVIGDLANRGIRVLPVVTSPPAWAAAADRPPLKSRRARNGWQKFLKAAVERYGPRGDFWTDPTLYEAGHPNGPKRAITTWQIWNEQNLKSGVQYVKPQKYRKLVGISHKAITRVDRKAKIVLGGMPGYVQVKAWAYLERLYQKRSFKRKFDSVAIHPYAPDVKHVFVQLKRLRQVMRRNHDRRSGLWITELGWGSKRPSKREPINKGPKGQKRMLKKTFSRLKHQRKRYNVNHAYWFDWRDEPRGTRACSFCTTSGLFRHNQKPKPAWRAFKQVTRPPG